MRVRYAGITIRRLMGLVALAALLMHVAITAHHVQYDRECKWIRHESVQIDGPIGPPEVSFDACVSPFWPQFWRKVLGRPWPGSYRCDCWETVRQVGTLGSSRVHSYQCISAHAVSEQEAADIEFSLRSIKTLLIPLVVDSPRVVPTEQPHQ